MKRLLMLSLLTVAIAVPFQAFAKKTTYIVTNKRLNYVKLVEIDRSVAEERNMTHPVEISVEKMREILSNLNLSKEHLIGEKVDSKQIFNEEAINYLAPALSRAFRDAKQNEEVEFSYIVKEPLVIIRNDRLTMVDAWISGNELFLDFKKLFAKVTGDTDKRGDYSKIISRSKGVRISLELGQGQQMASVGSSTVLIDLAHNYAPAANLTAESAASTKASDAETKTSKAKKSKYKKGSDAEEVAEVASTSSATTAAAASSGGEDDVTRRLEQLDMLRKRNLISSKEYKEKKAEILKGL